MKNILGYLPLHILLCVILGICIQFYTSFWDFGFKYLLLNLFLLFISLIVFSSYKRKLVFIILSSIIYIFTGVTSCYITNTINYDNHYLKYVKEENTFIVQLRKELKPNSFYNRFEAKVVRIDSFAVQGKVILNITKEAKDNRYSVGQFISSKNKFQTIKGPANPFTFNYKEYLLKKGIHHQIYINADSFIVKKNSSPSLIDHIQRLKTELKNKLKTHFKKEEYGIIASLLLGERNEVSKEMMEDYSKAGAVHILAISGLHIGIIVLLLNYLLSPLLLFQNGKNIRLILLIILLWLFAVLTGLSASVVRATTMFSFMAISMAYSEKQPIEYSIISSMLLLLLCNPMFLFDVGFQLSYIAVISIIKLQPLFYNLWKPKFFILDKTWQLTTVSLSAQLGVLPLSLYYFHQFPSLFLLSNLIIVPCLGILLIIGFVILILSAINYTPNIILTLYEKLIRTMNQIIHWIATQERFVFTGISVSVIEMVVFYMIIITFFHFLMKKKIRTLIAFLASILILQTVFLSNKIQSTKKEEFIIFHKNKTSVLGRRLQRKLILYTKDSTIQTSSFIQDYKTNQCIENTILKEKPNIFAYKNSLILCIDNSSIFLKSFPKNQIVLLSNAPKINLKRLITTLEPRLIIADGSNYKSYTERWKKTCEQQKTPFHDTRQNGAFILK